jgi:hypothetical protein
MQGEKIWMISALETYTRKIKEGNLLLGRVFCDDLSDFVRWLRNYDLRAKTF